MTHTAHDLTEFFPEATLHALKESNAHYVKLADAYHDLNRAIHRAETDIEPTDDVHLETMRKQRLALLDQIKALVNAA